MANGSYGSFPSVAAESLLGATIASGVTGSSLTSVGSITTGVWQGTPVANAYIASATTWNAKQDALVSGTNIKTINGNSVLGSGNLTISGGGGTTTAVASSRSLTSGDNGNILDVTNPGVTLTVPTGLGAGFACSIQVNGTTTFTPSGTTINGAGVSIARAYVNGNVVSLSMKSTVDTFELTGA